MTEVNNRLKNYEDFNSMKYNLDSLDLDNNIFKTHKKETELEKLKTERTISVKRKCDLENETSNDLKVDYKTISLPPKKKIRNTKNNELDEKFEKTFKKIKAPKKVINFETFYDRIMNFNINKKKDIEEKKKQKELEEEKLLRKVPLITIKSKNLAKFNEKPVHERCLIFKEEATKKKELMLKEKEQRIKRDEDQIIKENNSHKLEQTKINQKIDLLMEWEVKRRKKLSVLKEESEKKKNCEFSFIPKINKKNDKLTHSPDIDNHQSLTERLYTRDLAMRKVKKEKLETIYTPTFEPKINHSRKMVQNFNTKKLKENIIDTRSKNSIITNNN